MDDKKEDFQLAVFKDSWHFRYYCYIRRMWGVTKTPKMTSLCSYCQTMIWASILAVALSPLIILGWVSLKASRSLYKSLQKAGCDRFIDWFDGTMSGQILGKSDVEIKKSPILFTTFTFFFLVILLAVLVIIVSVPCFILFNAVMTLPKWPGAIWAATCWVGWGIVSLFWGIFFLFAWIGEGLYWTGFGVKWFFTNGPMWLAIGYWVAVAVFVSIGACVLSYLFYFVSRMAVARTLGSFVMMKINGFTEARAEATRRRDAMPKVNLPPKGPSKTWEILAAVGEFFARIFRKKIIDVGGTVTKVLTPFGMACQMILAIKRRACPIVKFVGGESLPRKEKPGEGRGHVQGDQGDGQP